MRTNLILAGLVIGVIGGFFIGQIGSDVLLRIVGARIDQLLLLGMLAIGLIAAAFLVSDRVIKAFTGARNTQIVKWFDDTSEKLAAALPITPDSREELKNKAQEAFAIYISWRVRAALFGMLFAVVIVIVGSISTHVALEQNRKIELQNELLDRQNQAVRMQILLAETARIGDNRARAEEWVNQITTAATEDRRRQREEHQEDTQQDAHYTFLTEDFWEETRLTLTLLEPYPVIDTSALAREGTDFRSIDVAYISRERGTILKSILDQRIDTSIVEFLNFDYADLRNFQLHVPTTSFGLVVPSCGVRKSDLSRLSLRNADLAGAQLSAVGMPLDSTFNVSSTVFYASRVSLPFGSRDPLEGERPGRVVLYDSQIGLPLPEEIDGSSVSLDNIQIVVDGELDDGSNCTEFSFVMAPDGPLIPEIRLAGATIIVTGLRGRSSASRMEVLEELITLSEGRSDSVVTVSEVASALATLLYKPDYGYRDELSKSLIAANSGTLARLQRMPVTADQVGQIGLFFQEEFDPEEILHFVLSFE